METSRLRSAVIGSVLACGLLAGGSGGFGIATADALPILDRLFGDDRHDKNKDRPVSGGPRASFGADRVGAGDAFRNGRDGRTGPADRVRPRTVVKGATTQQTAADRRRDDAVDGVASGSVKVNRGQVKPGRGDQEAQPAQTDQSDTSDPATTDLSVGIEVHLDLGDAVGSVPLFGNWSLDAPAAATEVRGGGGAQTSGGPMAGGRPGLAPLSFAVGPRRINPAPRSAPAGTPQTANAPTVSTPGNQPATTLVPRKQTSQILRPAPAAPQTPVAPAAPQAPAVLSPPPAAPVPAVPPPVAVPVVPPPAAPVAPPSAPAPQAPQSPAVRAEAPAAPALDVDRTPVSPVAFRAGYPEYLRSVQPVQLAGLALTGVAGLAILTAIGSVIGYRQARAGLAVRAAGTARFLQ